MIRSDLTAGAVMATMGVTASGVLDFIDRTTASTVPPARAADQLAPLPGSSSSVQGNTFTGFYSYDGRTGPSWDRLHHDGQHGLRRTGGHERHSTVVDTARWTSQRRYDPDRRHPASAGLLLSPA